MSGYIVYNVYEKLRHDSCIRIIHILSPYHATTIYEWKLKLFLFSSS
jgi:hypothetical protein